MNRYTPLVIISRICMFLIAQLERVEDWTCVRAARIYKRQYPEGIRDKWSERSKVPPPKPEGSPPPPRPSR